MSHNLPPTVYLLSATIYHPQSAIQHPPFHKDHRNKCNTHKRITQLLDTRTNSRTAGQPNCWTEGRTDRQTDSWTEGKPPTGFSGQTDRRLYRRTAAQRTKERIDCFNIVCSVLWARLALSTRRRMAAPVFMVVTCAKSAGVLRPVLPSQIPPLSSPHDNKTSR